MKEWKNKEIIIGLILLVVLLALALILIVRRETRQLERVNVPVDQIADENTDAPYSGISTEDLNKQREYEDTIIDHLKENENEIALEKEDEEMLTGTEQVGSVELSLDKNAISEYFTSPTLSDRVFGEEIKQLEELYYYWNEYKLDAVDDLIRLPRVRTAFTNELAGTNEFYYYGQLDSERKPHGSGLAVYENNAYYCGEWKNGKRHGKGMWLQIFPDKPASLNGMEGVIEHSYNGEWKDDYPNGSGQEHYEYDTDEMSKEEIITNVIGSFKDGYYDGDLYIMTIQGKDSSIDWEARAQKGTFEYRHNRYNTVGRRAVWEMMKKIDGEDEFYWIEESQNKNWGIFGLKK